MYVSACVDIVGGVWWVPDFVQPRYAEQRDALSAEGLKQLDRCTRSAVVHVMILAPDTVWPVRPV